MQMEPTMSLLKQRAVIEFLTKEGVKPKKIHLRLQNVYGESSISYASVKRWSLHFNSGNSAIGDKPRSGRPPSAVTADNRSRVDELIRNDRRLSVRDLVDKIGCGHSAIQKILSDLGYRKVCSQWVLNSGSGSETVDCDTSPPPP